MKSKKIVALALTAAMTISAIGMTAFAGSVEYSGGESKKLSNVKATVKIATDSEIITSASASVADIRKALAADNKTLDDPDLNTATETFKGWGDKYATNASGDGTTNIAGKIEDGNYVFVLEAQTEVTTDEEQITKNLEAIEKAKADAEAAKTLAEKLEELDKAHNADGKNGINTNSLEEIELKLNVDGAKKIGKEATDDFAYHALKVANVDTGDNLKTAFVFDIYTNENEAVAAGKTARATLKLGTKADLSKYNVTVYHIQDWCKATKVSASNIYAADGNVYVWADSFSPYVVVLSAKGSTGTKDSTNPSTGDFSAVPVVALAAAALGATGVVAYKKRKAE